ncbi:endothelial differentiation-related factor 1 homolog [Symsagittifera roscoffensis]|uniref:endothelial differentiation-related factor 1 homolog n=1 Tax=Symsagittifera roscoffensis TaxID=84072 RepID=UPI00307C9D27
MALNPGAVENQWEDVVISKRKPADTKSTKAVNAAMRTGMEVATEKKYGGGSNAQHATSKNTAKLDRETEELKVDKVPLTVAKAIQQARAAKEWSQKDLATKVNEKQSVINEYESCKAVPNQQVLGKLERTLGVKLRGKDIGQPLHKK